METSIQGTRVLFDEVAAPLYYAALNQINAVVPYSVGSRTQTRVQMSAWV